MDNIGFLLALTFAALAVVSAIAIKQCVDQWQLRRDMRALKRFNTLSSYNTTIEDSLSLGGTITLILITMIIVTTALFTLA